MTISHFKKRIQLERLAQFKVRRKKIMKSAWSDDGFTSLSVENELKINKSETQMLLRQMVEDGDLEKFIPEASKKVQWGNSSEYRKRGNANYWLKRKWRTG